MALTLKNKDTKEKEENRSGQKKKDVSPICGGANYWPNCQLRAPSFSGIASGVGGGVGVDALRGYPSVTHWK